MSLLSKAKEAVICLKAGVVTLPYPASAEPVPAGFRGRPVFDAAKCIGCAGCANNCPAREILIFDRSQEVRVLRYLGRRCTYCGRCFKEPGPLEALMMKGYRKDDIGSERWVYRSQSYLDDEPTVRDIEIELD